MAKKKVEVFLENDIIEYLKTISSNRSEAIRICVEEKQYKSVNNLKACIIEDEREKIINIIDEGLKSLSDKLKEGE